VENPSLQDKLRHIPSVDKLLSEPLIVQLQKKYSDEMLKRAIRIALDNLRKEVLAGSASEAEFTPESLACRTETVLNARIGRRLTTVINATGVVVHTNLGRSPLSQRVAERIMEAAVSYSNLEYNLDQGRRGERNSHLRQIMLELTGAESVLSVNNNAAAVLLALDALAKGREVIVSRGELIEIGGSFRIPDVMARSGAILREVGTTNRTHPRDYVNAINENTALILKVHTSNYRIVGFTREVELDEMVAIGREHGVPTMIDLGSGCLMDLSPYGLTDEPTVQQILASGVDVVSFSGDKLLGGPQAGILAGRFEYIEKMRTNPLARALRMDKLTLAALEATLEEYVSAAGPAAGIPSLAMITKSPAELHNAAEALAQALVTTLGQEAEISIEPGVGRVGGGALPLGDLPGPRVAIHPRNLSAARLEKELRSGKPPAIALVKENSVLLDPRTLLHDQHSLIPHLVLEALERAKH
jgi:L-seryl-tRNA(Ser) seleniumtransferase